jgi:hypothetical protein
VESQSNEHAETEVYQCRDTIEMCFEAPEMLGCSQTMDMDMSTCNNGVAMLEQEPRLGNWGLSIIRECSDSERTNLEMGSCVGYATINQDTGYYTGSLQLTNQDTGILHTNLTQQMSCLPLNSDNECQSKVVDDSGLNFCSTSRGVENNTENIYSESGFPFSNFHGKMRSGVCPLENSSSSFPCSKDYKPLMQIFPNNHDCGSVSGSFKVCNSRSLPKMVQSGLGVPIFSWDPTSV